MSRKTFRSRRERALRQRERQITEREQSLNRRDRALVEAEARCLNLTEQLRSASVVQRGMDRYAIQIEVHPQQVWHLLHSADEARYMVDMLSKNIEMHLLECFRVQDFARDPEPSREYYLARRKRKFGL